MGALEGFMAERLSELIDRIDREIRAVDGLLERGPSDPLASQLRHKRTELSEYASNLEKLLGRVEVLR
jgi:hypothetical protein